MGETIVKSYILGISWSPDAMCIASGSANNSINVQDSDTGDVLDTMTGHTDTVIACNYSHRGNYMVSGSLDKSIIVWDTESSKLITKLEGHNGRVLSVA